MTKGTDPALTAAAQKLASEVAPYVLHLWKRARAEHPAEGLDLVSVCTLATTEEDDLVVHIVQRSDMPPEARPTESAFECMRRVGAAVYGPMAPAAPRDAIWLLINDGKAISPFCLGYPCAMQQGGSA
jgi:hypothetical protein